MKKFLLLYLCFLLSCSSENPTPIGQKYHTELAGIEATLSFHPDGRFYGQMINNYFGIYKINQDQIKLTLQGTGMKFRTPNQIEIEEKYFASLKEITSYKLNKNTLLLIGNKNQYIFTRLNSD